MQNADYLSIPTAKTPSPKGLALIARMPIRENPAKPGRTLEVVWDSRYPLTEGFNNEYSYVVRFVEAGNAAGYHYHLLKEEIFYVMSGELLLRLRDIGSGVEEELDLKPECPVMISTGIAHAVVAKTAGAVLLVLASYPNTEDDEFSCNQW